MVSVYVEVQNTEALLDSINKLHQLINETRNRIGTRVDVILAGDFNRHDQLWGGDDVSQNRQGEADPIVKRSYRSVLYAEDHMNRSVGTAECVTLLMMHKTFQILQLNLRKQRQVQHSLMNDQRLKDFGVIAISEPYTWTIDNTVATVPMGHQNWTKMVPTVQRGERWAFRSMLRIHIHCDGVLLEHTWHRLAVSSRSTPCVPVPDICSIVVGRVEARRP